MNAQLIEKAQRKYIKDREERWYNNYKNHFLFSGDMSVSFFADKRYCDDLTVGRFFDSNGDIFNHLLSKTT